MQPQIELHEESAAPASAWRRLWQRPEPQLVDVGYGGEILIAGVRLLVVIILVYIPASEYVGQGFEGGDIRALLAAAAAGLVGALAVYSAVNRSWGRSWIGFASSLLDVTMVSGLLGMLVVLGRPYDAVHDTVIFPVYLLAIAATSLRYDPRICLFTGSLAVVEYSGLVLWAAAGPAVPAAAGAVSWGLQAVRLATLAAATGLAATIVVRARDLRSLSSRDRFTGLLNRTTFDERLRRETILARATGGELAVAMVDVDHFKRFNDTYGHAGGDEALRRVAEILRRSFRDTDAVARYGGEEFSVLLPGVGIRQTRPLLERIRSAVEDLTLLFPAHDAPARLTVSIGVAIWPHDGDAPGEILEAADRRLYQAKQGGRNLVVGPPGPVPTLAGTGT
ncbi:MAG TPA: GGDEF domain-containing protein [Thermoanaerobaculia bacterium]|nr:GGDEF domain-containing protein [Thermoanaerobaculia bacterium]